MSVRIKARNFIKNNKNHLILSGEIHYFRLPKHSWQMHLEIAKSMGINTITTYVPWLIHEPQYRNYQFEDQYDLSYFLSLCQGLELDVILKPGPFIMAEMKNEGIPYWLYEKYPEIIPRTWHGKKANVPLIDYTHEIFLSETKIWYKKLFSLIKPFTTNIGPVIGVQLDNEVGMLPWISNQPILSKSIEDKFKLLFLNYPRIEDHESLMFHRVLSNLSREKFQFYIEFLHSILDELNLVHLLSFINIHGTSNDRGKTFPVGINQLIKTYANNHIIPGLDLYFGNIDLENFHDLYICNSFVHATTKNKPYGTMELNVADGNFGDNLAIHYMPSSIDFKIRFAFIQGQKLFNYYLLTGGINPKLSNPKSDDLNLRSAITGARHGFAAPVQPNGDKMYLFPYLKKITLMLSKFSAYLSDLEEVTDDIALCLILDSYQTEYQQPDDKIIQERNNNLSLHRNSVLWDTFLKQTLLLQYRFKSLWIENCQDIPSHKLLFTNTSKYMDHITQVKFVNCLKRGGKIVFVGDLPTCDLEGRPDTTLIDYLKIKPLKNYYDWTHPLLTLTSNVSVYGETEFRSFIAQSIDSIDTALYHHLITQEKIGVKTKNYVWITSNYPGHLDYTKEIFNQLHVTPNLNIKQQTGFVLAFKQRNKTSTLYHLINLEHYQQKIKLFDHHIALFDGHDIELNAQEALMLWKNLHINKEIINYSTLEIIDFTLHTYTLNSNLKHGYLSIKTKRKLKENPYISFTQKNDIYLINITQLKATITLEFID